MSTEPNVAPEAAPASPSPVPAEQTPAAPPTEGAQVPAEAGQEELKADKPRQRASERIGELYGRMKAAERERDMAIQEAQRLRQPVVDQSQWDQLTYEQQQAVQVRQAVRQERSDEMVREAERRAYESQQTRASMFQERLESVRGTIPDIDAVINDPHLPVSEIGARFIQESDVGPQVAYWLSQNRADAARIARLDPYSQAFEMGRIEQRITAAPVARKVSQAPAPVPRVGGGATSGAKDPAAMNEDEYAAWYRARRR